MNELDFKENSENTESYISIPVSDFRRLIGTLERALNYPEHRAAQQLGKTALRTLRDYLPEATLEEIRRQIAEDQATGK